MKRDVVAQEAYATWVSSEEAVTRAQAGSRKATDSWKPSDQAAFTTYLRERRRSAKRPPGGL
jgi:hypothetical protein